MSRRGLQDRLREVHQGAGMRKVLCTWVIEEYSEVNRRFSRYCVYNVLEYGTLMGRPAVYVEIDGVGGAAGGWLERYKDKIVFSNYDNTVIYAEFVEVEDGEEGRSEKPSVNVYLGIR
jgi:hypothetical protein